MRLVPVDYDGMKKKGNPLSEEFNDVFILKSIFTLQIVLS